MRATYGPGWAMLYAHLRSRLPRHRVARVASFAGAILAVELATLPFLLGAPLVRPRVLAALGVHVTLFAVVVELALRASSAPAPRRARR